MPARYQVLKNMISKALSQSICLLLYLNIWLQHMILLKLQISNKAVTNFGSVLQKLNCQGMF
jgi:hypothetical protein